MKVLHIIPRFSVGGAERLVLEYAKVLPKQGIEMATVAVREENFFAALNRLSKFTKDFNPDIIHTHIFAGDLAGYFLKKKFPKLKWITTQHSLAIQNTRFRRLILRCVLRRADKIIAVSEHVKKSVVNYFKTKSGEITVLPNAIDIEPWLKVSENTLLKSNFLRLAIVGRLAKEKGHEFLFKQLVHVKKIQWELHIFGEGELGKHLRKLAKDLKIDKKIFWHGAVSDLPQRLENIDVVVVPSLHEGMSLAVMEAMAAGRLVMVSSAAGEGLVEHMKTGIIFNKAKDNRYGIIDIGGALEWFSEDIEKAKKIAGRARVFAKNNFGIDSHIEALVNIYDALCKIK